MMEHFWDRIGMGDKKLRVIYVCKICGNEDCTCVYGDIRKASPSFKVAKKNYNNRWERVELWEDIE